MLRLRGGSKNGSFSTVARARFRWYSTVTSISIAVPGAAWAASTVANATYCFRMGEKVWLVACPICRPLR